jgi:hypothetical protein
VSRANKSAAGAAQNDFQESSARLASSPGSPELKFQREDWSLFRTLEGLQQKAGVPKHKLPWLVLKELTDNALDTGTKVRIGPCAGGYFVEDDGPGIDGTPEEIAELYSIARPLISTKLLRLPTRGALGNGLRVVAGVVLASSGSLAVVTGNYRIASPRARRHHDGCQREGGHVPGRHPRRGQVWPRHPR